MYVGGVLTQEESYRFPPAVENEFNWKMEIFIGNDFKKVVYLGKEVYKSSACSLI